MKISIIALLVSLFSITCFSQDAITCNKADIETSYELKDFFTLISAIIVVVGWFVNSYLNRMAEIRKRRSEHRLTALKSVVENLILDMSKDINIAFKKTDFKDKVENARATIQLYGYRNEIEAYEEFVAALNIQVKTVDEETRKLQKINESLPKLSVIIESLRKELGLEIYDKKKINF